MPADLSSHRLADAVKGGELSYMALALQREPTAYRLLLMAAGAVLADPEPMLARLVRGCIALAFTASLPAHACSHFLPVSSVLTIKGGELSYMARAVEGESAAYRSLLIRPGAALATPQPMLARLVRGFWFIAMARPWHSHEGNVY